MLEKIGAMVAAWAVVMFVWLVCLAVFAIPVSLAWSVVMHGAFGLPDLGWRQAFALIFLSSVLVKGVTKINGPSASVGVKD